VNNDSGGDRRTASRVRIRQNVDLSFDPQFKTHLQLELGHTPSNITTSSTDLKARHAVLDYTFDNGINAQAGIVPVSDHFGDVLFSGDWNYNPVALAFVFPAGAGKLRAFAGNLNESTETVKNDDIVHYQFDYLLPLKGGNKFNIGMTWLEMGSNGTNRAFGAAPFPAMPTTTGRHLNYGAGGSFTLDGLTLNTFVAGARTDREILGTSANGKGVAVKLELTGKAGTGTFGILGTWAQGEPDGSGFQAPLAFVPAVDKGANSYWGYLGLLTVQGPTDTGIDGDSVNISNNGYGLSSLQAKYAFPISGALSGYLAAGWFGGSKAAGRDRDVGAEVMAMGTYRFNKVLALDFGAAHARLKDSVSGYSQGAAGAFNQAPGVARDKTALFSRLQAEF